MWQIIGAGAIGCLWAANLKITGQDVHLVTRTPLPSNKLHYLDLHQKRSEVIISSSCQLKNKQDPILLCVKATQVKEAILTHQHAIDKRQVIILMHNGMGCAEQVQAILPDNPIISATTANACLYHGPLDIQQTGSGPTYLGAFNTQAYHQAPLAKRLNLALNNTHWVEDIQHKLWLKLLINSAINPLTALYQIKNGELQTPYFQEKLRAICQEIAQVAQAERLNFPLDELLNIVNQVIIATSENYSSMNRDIFFKRKTENKYINGYLLKKAQDKQMSTPIINDLYHKIQQAENTFKQS